MVSERRAFGAELKQQRERRKITLQSISQDSKVPASLFEGLERGDCSRWPAAIYGRAYVRAYADAVGLDASRVVERFTAIYHPAPPGESGAAPSDGPGLRLSMDDGPAFKPALVAKRAALAGADLVIGFLIASVAYTGLGLGVWTTVGCVLAYFTAGRVISDDPLLYWMYLRMRTAGLQSPDADADDKVRAVGDAASTTA